MAGQPDTPKQFAADIYTHRAGLDRESAQQAAQLADQAERFARAYEAYLQDGIEAAITIIKQEQHKK